MKILFRTNSGTNIGLGHLYRCISLAKAIKTLNNNIKIAFVINEEAINILKNYYVDFLASECFDEKDLKLIKSINPNMIVFDSYLANDEYLKKLANISKLAVFDDNDNIYNLSSVNIIINGNLPADTLYFSKKENIKYLLGPKYLVMKQEYWDLNKKDLYPVDNYKTIMITTGGADNNNLMLKFINSLKDLGTKLKIIIGQVYTEEEINKIKKIAFGKNIELVYKPVSLKEQIQTSDLVITSTGLTVYEILLLKKPLIIYTSAENQKQIAMELEKYGVFNLGWFENIKWDRLPFYITKLCKDLTSYAQNFNQSFELIDGQGALRISRFLLKQIMIC